MSAQFLHQRKYLPVNDGGVSIREYLPFVFRFIELFLHFERLAISSKVDGITAVFLFIKNARYSIRYPAIGNGGRFTAFSSDTVPILRRS